MGKFQSYQSQLQEAIENGINMMEEQQKKMAAMQFDYAEKIESDLREHSVKGLREQYNSYSQSMFGPLQEVFENGVSTLVEQQKKLATMPFDFAEKLEGDARGFSVKELRERCEGYNESFFEQIRTLNSRFGNAAAEITAKLEKQAEEGVDSVSEMAKEVSEKFQVSVKPATAKKSAAA